MLYAREWSLSRAQVKELLASIFPGRVQCYWPMGHLRTQLVGNPEHDQLSFALQGSRDQAIHGQAVVWDRKIEIQLTLPDALHHQEASIRTILDQEFNRAEQLALQEA